MNKNAKIGKGYFQVLRRFISMPKGNYNADKIAQIFGDYCKKQNYQMTLTKTQDNDLRLEISNLRDRAIVIIYHTSSIVIQGSPNTLKVEMEALKKDFEKDPSSFIPVKFPESKACAMRYDIMLPELRKSVKEKIDDIRDTNVNVSDNPNMNIEYLAKIKRGSYSLTFIQYSNGTLLLQGKTDALFHECCDLIESLCNPSQKEVISRFISSDEESLKVFIAKYTPELVGLAETKTKESLGVAYDYLEPYDQKWFVASECISMAEVPLPEYSPVVMPASKALEGFAKKLLVDIGLLPKDHWKNKNANFAVLNDHNHPSRKAICEKEKHTDSFLEKLSVCLDMSRNFMMHSDDAKVTKVESLQEAREKLNSISKDTKEIFEYFNDIYKFR